MLKIWWLKLLKHWKCSKSDGWRSLKCWRMQNLMVEITENIELRKIWWLKLPKTLKCSKSYGWRSLKRWRTPNLMVEVDRKHWTAQNLMVEDYQNAEERKIWWLKYRKTLKYAKSNGWSRIKHWRMQNLMVEDA